MSNVIKWVSESDLGEININLPCVKRIEAITDGSSNITYSITDGELPNYLQLNTDGEIFGKPISPLTGGNSYTFEVTASGINLQSISRTFSLQIKPFTNNDLQYTNIHMVPFFDLNKRNKWNAFLEDISIFPPSMIYRPYDPAFEFNREFKTLLIAGVFKTDMTPIFSKVNRNVDTVLYYGTLGTSVAKETMDGPSVYDIVYYNMMDSNSMNNIHSTNNNSIFKWRYDILSQCIVRNRYNPLWMKTIQPNILKEVIFGYKLAMPICYCKPGYGQKILNNIVNSNFNITQYEYKINKLILENINNKYTDLYANEYIHIGV